ncbi:MAG: Rpn family recombination-promoting nuclease/putative transposase [Blautia sp.]|nr:Rpn family recombination-promoting nuclease/putative transposase [Blautia sp.]
MSECRKLQELTIKDNFMFGAVMVDEELCKEFLELALGFRIAKVTVSKEKSIVYHPEYKGVRLDVIAADEKQTHYNVEMQVLRKKNLGKRSRYYHSQIDMELLRTGMEYGLLPDAYVIFICDFDPFYKKKYKYTFDTVCKEDGTVSLEDGNHTLFLSTCGENEGEVPEGLVKFLKYVKAGLSESTENFQDGFVQKLQDAVRNVKASREMEERYMLLQELLKEEREAGRAEGRAEGRAQGRAEGKAEGRAQGRAEGRAEGKAESILELLSDLGDIPEDLQKRISVEKDPNVLKSYLKIASASKTIDEFRKRIDQP